MYVGKSHLPGAGEGLIARRRFHPGDLVSYFGGKKTFRENFLLDNMTAGEKEDAASYFFNIGKDSPGWWGVPRDLVIDTPTGMRDIVDFRTTLGHKANSQWGDTRTCVYLTVRHPVLGPIACLVARVRIEPRQEVTVSYGYKLDSAPAWYVRQYQLAQQELEPQVFEVKLDQ